MDSFMNNLDKIQNLLGDDLLRMNNVIRESLKTPNELMDRVVTNYLAVKGKQIRPIMVLLSAHLFGDVNEDALHAGAALEMLHNASLIHDDVVDDTDLRRGRNTINREWGNHIAVLMGDFFVSNALAAGIKTGNISIISTLSDLGKKLATGEVEQICNAREHSFEEERYLEMINKKTACLFESCVKMGAESNGVAPEEYKALGEYGRLLGLCFQIRDDIFDYTASAEIGKPTGNDLREGKVTMPLLYALRTAPESESQPMKEFLVRGDLTTGEIERLIDFAIEHGGIEYAYSRMRAMQKEAEHLLDPYPDSKWKESFRELFEYIISRNN